MGLTLRRLPYIWAKSSQMKKTILLFALLSCWFGSAQIIEFTNIGLKNYLLGANPSNGRASTGTATFNYELVRLESSTFTSTNDLPTNSIFLFDSYHSIDTNNDGEIQLSEAAAITYLNLDIFEFSEDNNSNDEYYLEFFTNLKYLGLMGVSHLYDGFDLSSNISLEMLNISYCDIYNLDISQNYNLTHFVANSVISPNVNVNGINFNNLPNLKFLTVRDSFFSIDLNLPQSTLLEELYCLACHDNTIDFSLLPSLKSLVLWGEFPSLDFTTNNLLENVIIDNQYHNSTLIGLNQKPALQYLLLKYDSEDNVTTDLSQNISLEELTFTNTYSSPNPNSNINFDLSGNVSLTKIDFDTVPGLITLDLSELIQLTELSIISCYNLQSLDVSSCPNLFKLFCIAENIEYVNIKNNNPNWSTEFNNLVLATPNLIYVCTNEENINYVQSRVDAFNNNNNVNINNYCSFDLGGNSPEINGNVRINNDEVNCEASEVKYPFLKINISNETDEGFYFANQDGFYTISVGSGSHTLTPELENPDYFNVSPESITVEFPATESPFEQHFCVTPNGIYHDLEVTVIPLDNAVPGFDASYKILYKNKGNQPENPSLTFTYDDAVLDFLSSSVVPNTTMSGLLSWNLEPLNVFESGFIIVNFNLNTPMETPPLNSDDVLSFQSFILVGDLPDVNPEDNNFTLNQLVVNSYDPNDKTCLEGQSIHPDMIGEFVHYRIRFENTGTFPAQNVVIKDMIDATKFDITTLQMVDASHDCRTRISGQKVEFIFENIQLDFNDATNDGYVVFKIKTLPSLTLNSTISNTAEIYFDFNFPIITNTETSTFEIILSNENFTFENELILHPNPTKNMLSLTSVNGILIQDVEIYNLQGQKVMEIRNASQNLDVSRLQAGTYLIKVFTNEGSSNAKFIKE